MQDVVKGQQSLSIAESADLLLGNCANLIGGNCETAYNGRRNSCLQKGRADFSKYGATRVCTYIQANTTTCLASPRSISVILPTYALRLQPRHDSNISRFAATEPILHHPPAVSIRLLL